MYAGAARDQGNWLGVTGNIFWYRGDWQGGPPRPAPFALDTRNGQSIFASGTCPSIAPVTDDTFIVPTSVPEGPITLPGGGQINGVHVFGATLGYGSPSRSGGIADGDTIRPKQPLYYVPDPLNPNGMVTQGTLGVLPGALWDVTVPVQHFLAGSSGSFGL